MYLKNFYYLFIFTFYNIVFIITWIHPGEHPAYEEYKDYIKVRQALLSVSSLSLLKVISLKF